MSRRTLLVAAGVLSAALAVGVGGGIIVHRAWYASAEPAADLAAERKGEAERRARELANRREEAREIMSDAVASVREIDKDVGFAEVKRRVNALCRAVVMDLPVIAERLPYDARAVAACKKVEQLAEQLKSPTPVPPDEPTEPSAFEAPRYTGCVELSGTIRAPFREGGVVLESGGKLLLLEDGAMPRSDLVTFLHGYADDTGRTIKLDFGRTGRDAKVYRVRDKESYDDDQKSHREKAAAARQEHQGAMARYQRKRREYSAKLKEHKAALAGHKQTRADAEKKLRELAAGLREK